MCRFVVEVCVGVLSCVLCPGAFRVSLEIYRAASRGVAVRVDLFPVLFSGATKWRLVLCRTRVISGRSLLRHCCSLLYICVPTRSPAVVVAQRGDGGAALLSSGSYDLLAALYT